MNKFLTVSFSTLSILILNFSTFKERDISQVEKLVETKEVEKLVETTEIVPEIIEIENEHFFIKEEIVEVITVEKEYIEVSPAIDLPTQLPENPKFNINENISISASDELNITQGSIYVPAYSHHDLEINYIDEFGNYHNVDPTSEEVQFKNEIDTNKLGVYEQAITFHGEEKKVDVKVVDTLPSNLIIGSDRTMSLENPITEEAVIQAMITFSDYPDYENVQIISSDPELDFNNPSVGSYQLIFSYHTADTNGVDTTMTTEATLTLQQN